MRAARFLHHWDAPGLNSSALPNFFVIAMKQHSPVCLPWLKGSLCSGGILLACLLGMTGCSVDAFMQRSQPSSAPSAESPVAHPAKVATAPPSKAVEANNQGVEKLQKADYKGALKNFTQAIQANGKLAEAYLGRGIAYSGLGNRPAALKDYGQAIRLHPKLASAYLNRADEYIALNQKKAAIADLQQAVKLFQQQGDQSNVRLATSRLEDMKNNMATAAAPVTTAEIQAQVEAARSRPVPSPIAVKPQQPVSAESALAKHLSQIGAKMYVTHWCPYCRRQEALFGDAVRQLTIIECDPNGANAQPQLCNAANVSSYPTWEINGQIYRGMRPLQNLAEISGYRGPRNFSS